MNDMALDFTEEDIQRLLDNLDSFSPEEVADVTLNAVEAAFLTEEEKDVLRQEVLDGYRTLGVDPP